MKRESTNLQSDVQQLQMQEKPLSQALSAHCGYTQCYHLSISCYELCSNIADAISRLPMCRLAADPGTKPHVLLGIFNKMCDMTHLW